MREMTEQLSGGDIATIVFFICATIVFCTAIVSFTIYSIFSHE